MQMDKKTGQHFVPQIDADERLASSDSFGQGRCPRASKYPRARGLINISDPQRYGFCRPRHGFTLVELLVVMEQYMLWQGNNARFPDVVKMPSIDPARPSILDVLGPYTEGNEAAFQCPSDTKYARGQNGGRRGPGARGGRGRRGGGTSEQRQERMKNRLDHSDPAKRAKGAEYRSAMKKRREDLGLPPMRGRH